MRTKWASRSLTGRLWFNLELAKKPPRTLEYIVVHELAHLIERQHGAEFQAVRWWPGHQSPCSPRQARSTRALMRCQARVLYRTVCRLRLDCRACSVQRLPARLVTTPQTVQSFTPESSIG